MKFRIALIGLFITGAVQGQAPVTDVNTGSIEQRMAALERQVNARSGSQHNIQQQLEGLQSEVDELRGSVELHTHKLEQILQRQRELYLEIDKRIESVVAKPTDSFGSLDTDLPVSNPQPIQSADENTAYDTAVNLILRDKRYEDAIPAFEAFLSQFPQSSYAANAHYWLGQLQFNKQDYTASSEQFQTVVNRYPDSSKRADSILKLGMIAQSRSNLAKAVQLYEQVMSEYPDSSAAKLADPRLRAIK